MNPPVWFLYDGVNKTNQATINVSDIGTINDARKWSHLKILKVDETFSKANYSVKKRDTLISTIASVGLEKAWKTKVQYDTNFLNKKLT